MRLPPWIRILRPVNCLLGSLGIVIGYWISRGDMSGGDTDKGIPSLFMLVLSGIFATGFGNTINDLMDRETDRISHPDRPLVTGDISFKTGIFLCILLFSSSLYTAVTVSVYHLFGALIPLLLLLIYSLFLKGMPLAGNITVSLLVAYCLYFGSIGSGNTEIVFWPAVIAFMLNLSREIVKDIQDKDGDTGAHIKTTAVLPENTLSLILVSISITTLFLILMPFISGYFSTLYLFLSVILLFPLHIYTLLLETRKVRTYKKISNLLKTEMAGGLLIMAADIYFQGNQPS